MNNLPALLVVGAMLGLPLEGKADLKLNFGVYTSEKPTGMVKQFRPVLDALEARMSETMGQAVTIGLQVAKDYKAGLENIAEGKVDFSRVGPASFMEVLSKSPGASLLAVELVDGEEYFYGIICVRSGSDIQEVSELKGRRFAFGNERSTIGRYLSQHYLAEHGVKARDLADFAYLGRHDKVGSAVGAPAVPTSCPC